MNISDLANLEIPSNTTALVRLNSVRDGIVANKSLRQIALELGCDEGTVRRDRDKLLLPSEKRSLVFDGATYEPIRLELIGQQLEAERRRLEAALQRRRAAALESEATSGARSNELCNSILRFLDGLDLNQPSQYQLLLEVERRCWFAGDFPEDWYIEDHDVAIEVQKPEPTGTKNRMFWMQMWLYRAEPKRDIRDRGIVKARRILERKPCGGSGRSAFAVEMMAKGYWPSLM